MYLQTAPKKLTNFIFGKIAQFDQNYMHNSPKFSSNLQTVRQNSVKEKII